MSLEIIAMIPARMGSQRLKKKNLRQLDGVSLLARAVQRCKDASVFDAIWVNGEHPAFGEIAASEGVGFHKRPAELASNTATSEDFVYEFLLAHECDFVIQVHSIAPLLAPSAIKYFVEEIRHNRVDVLLSVVNEQIECLYDGQPVNFTFDAKTNSQKLLPIERVTWSITGWRRSAFIEAVEAGRCATYSGRVGTFPIDRAAGHIIKTEADLQIAEALLPLYDGKSDV